MKNEAMYGLFYYKNDKWYGPYRGEYLTKKQIIYYSELDKNNPFTSHIESFLNNERKRLKNKVELRRQTWEIVYSKNLPELYKDIFRLED